MIERRRYAAGSRRPHADFAQMLLGVRTNTAPVGDCWESRVAAITILHIYWFASHPVSLSLEETLDDAI
jgi:hypothetical protein